MPKPPYLPKATNPQFLRYILALDRAGSFRAAADLASVSQPTLSNAIQSWEKAMGVILFERGHRGVTPTTRGQQIIEAARTALDNIEQLERLTNRDDGPFFGPVRMGMIPTVGPYAMPFIHEACRLAYPDLVLEPEEGKTDELIEALERGQLDMAMVAELPGMRERYTVDTVYKEPFVLAMPLSHQHSNRKRLSINDINLNELLLLNEGHCLRDQALEICRISGGQSDMDQYRATSLETLRQLVAEGYGVTLLPTLSVRSKPENLRICKLSPAPARDIVFIWRTTDPRASAYIELVDAIRYSVPGEWVKVHQ